MKRLRLAILISGRGSNMQAILRAAQEPDYPLDPVLVICNRPDAPGLAIAKAHGVKAMVLDHKLFGNDREAFERTVTATLKTAKTQLVALAGFMRILGPHFVNEWTGRVLNIHPSLLPKYPGLDTHQRALSAGDSEAGCTVHWVTENVDSGEIVNQARIPVLPDDNVEKLARRVLAAEHRLYPHTLAMVARRLVSKRPDRNSREMLKN